MKPIETMNNIFETFGFRLSRVHASTSFPPLPIELVRYIIELAAAQHRTIAFRLSLVSRIVREWTTPILYSAVILPNAERLSLFHSLLLSGRSSIAMHVTNLALRSMSTTSGGRAAEVLSRCTRVERLVVDSLYRQHVVDQSLPWPTPWEVVFIYGAASWLHKHHPSLQQVTHIHLDRILFDATLDICLALPRLTHIGITHMHLPGDDNDVYDINFIRLVKRLLTLGPSLEMVLVQLQPCVNPELGNCSGRIWRKLAKIKDTRLLARPTLAPEEYFKVLENGTTIWDHARAQFAEWRIC
ncbi:hypothetical protein K439DRAFT_1062281 [Ramaria rubella]|nr:hypothetical protein K439DRAFT_1062281 [Ramaria rubella]